MIKCLVNVITPAYNCANYIPRLLNSILSQSYPNIEMIVIDDGSSDNTADVIKSYIHKFEARGFLLHYVYQENQGQSSAINNALKLVNGEYLVWPDSDDWYDNSEAIAKMVNSLAKSDDSVGTVRCGYKRINESTNETIRIDYPNQNGAESLFERAVTGVNNNVWLEPGGYMVKLKFLDEIIINREIYHSRYTGQNTQILWPYFFYKKCISIEEPLFCYLIRVNSHSRNQFSDFEKKVIVQKEVEKTFCEVINSIRDIEETKRTFYIDCQHACVNKILANLSVTYGKKEQFDYYYYKWSNKQASYPIDRKTMIIYNLSKVPLFFTVITHLLNALKQIKAWVEK